LIAVSWFFEGASCYSYKIEALLTGELSKRMEPLRVEAISGFLLDFIIDISSTGNLFMSSIYSRERSFYKHMLVKLLLRSITRRIVL
jgi:hypothetical protein